ENRKSFLLAIYALIMVFFVAVNTTIILILLLPVMISKARHYNLQQETTVSAEFHSQPAHDSKPN
ncbi:capsular polysaccharide synthesis enzyme cpsG Lipid A core-O-antigen ligase domain protein, partial [Vibrio harveyi]